MNTAESSKRYRPKGSMCIACAKRVDNCSYLDFSKMPVMARDKQDGAYIVKCSEFVRAKRDQS